MEIENRPPPILPSSMPAWFVIKNNHPDSKRVKATISLDGQQIGSLLAYSSSNQLAYFELGEFFDANLSGAFNGHLPHVSIFEPLNDPDNRPGAMFEVSFSDDSSNTASQGIFIVKARLSMQGKKTIGYGYTHHSVWSFLTGTSRTLSLRPLENTIFYPGQPQALYIPSWSLTHHGPIAIACQVLYPDGSWESFTYNAGSINISGAIYQVLVGYEKFLLEALVQNFLPTDPIPVAYKVQLLHNSTPLSPQYTFNINFTKGLDTCIVYRNSLGGWDTFCPQGFTSHSYETQNEYADVIPFPHSPNNTLRLKQHSQRHSIIIGTGHLPHYCLGQIHEMAASDMAYLIKSGQSAMPIVFDSTRLSIQKIQGQMIQAQIPVMINTPAAAEQLYDPVPK